MFEEFFSETIGGKQHSFFLVSTDYIDRWLEYLRQLLEGTSGFRLQGHSAIWVAGGPKRDGSLQIEGYNDLSLSELTDEIQKAVKIPKMAPHTLTITSNSVFIRCRIFHPRKHYV